MRMPSAAAALLACAACALATGCGPPDNVVNGGVNSADKTKFPDAFIPEVHSAIHFNGTATNIGPGATGGPVPRSIVILSGQDGLCASLQSTPDYFKSAPQGFTALILMTPQGIDGTFAVAATANNADASLLASFRGGPVALLPAVADSVSVTEFNTAGNARGSFNLLVAASNGSYSVYGRFKTSACPAIANAYLPFVR